jgi:hypothetical protein
VSGFASSASRVPVNRLAVRAFRARRGRWRVLGLQNAARHLRLQVTTHAEGLGVPDGLVLSNRRMHLTEPRAPW